MLWRLPHPHERVETRRLYRMGFMPGTTLEERMRRRALRNKTSAFKRYGAIFSDHPFTLRSGEVNTWSRWMSKTRTVMWSRSDTNLWMRGWSLP